MSLRSKLKLDDVGLFAAGAFYAAVGIVSFVVLFSDIELVHIGIIGTFSLIAAYGLFTRRVWTIWFVVTLFFVATTVSAYTLYLLAGRDATLDVSMLLYLALTWIFTVYVAARRKVLET